MTPLVSIIIPCYNKAQYLEETLDTVAAQTYPSIEIVVVDDDSPDNTKEVVERYMQRINNLHYIHQPNQGPSASRNNGIKASHGEYIMALDADDTISPTYVEKCVNYLTEHDEIKLVYTLADTFGIRNGEWDLPPYSHEALLWTNMIHYCAMYRRDDFLCTQGYNTNMVKGFEDWDFWLTFLKPTDKVHCIEERLFHWRVLEYSRSFDADQNMRSLLQQIYHNHRELYEPYHQDILYFHEMWTHNEWLYHRADKVRHTHAYRIGKILLKPITWLRKLAR